MPALAPMTTIFLPKSADLAGVSRFQVGDDYLGHLVQTRAQNLVPVLRGLSAPRDFFSERLKHFVIGSLSKWAILDMRRAPTRRGFLEMPCQPGVTGLPGPSRCHQSGCEMLVEEHLQLIERAVLRAMPPSHYRRTKRPTLA
ncbi:hypothetical protein AJ87_35225 [Rhizobium yanglingense]|nr:hypothetical protein AJ87_35225 [Rhizobium yanglingense]